MRLTVVLLLAVLGAGVAPAAAEVEQVSVERKDGATSVVLRDELRSRVPAPADRKAVRRVGVPRPVMIRFPTLETVPGFGLCYRLSQTRVPRAGYDAETQYWAYLDSGVHHLSRPVV